jgi:glycosyltransferase involved in cell wall biosynthesis
VSIHPLKIIFVHNTYQQYGGEDTVVEQEEKLLKDAGNLVFNYSRTNDEIKKGFFKKIAFPFTMIWSLKTYSETIRLLKTIKPDVVHIHNTFFMVSPSVYWACKKMKVAVVQSLYNPRYMCPAGSLTRNGNICELCLGKNFPYFSIIYKCYRNSRVLSALVSCMLFFHKAIKTADRTVDVFINATQFYQKKFVEAGLDIKNLEIKPHFVFPDPGCRTSQPEEYVAFVGRFDPEKGISTLLKAWESLKDIPLKMRGTGKLLQEVLGAKEKLKLPIELIGKLSKEEMMNFLKKARFLVFPSEGYYETFGMVIIEAFACGVPVLASRIGVMTELVDHNETGMLFQPSNPQDLVRCVKWSYEHPKEMMEMGMKARRVFEEKYTVQRNYEQMMQIYKKALNNHRAPGRVSS